MKSLVHAVATFNSNMHIKFQVNRIISMIISYNSDFKNIGLRKTHLKFGNMFKAT